MIQLRRIALPLIALVAAGCASQAQRTEVAANGDTAPSAKDKAIIEQRAIEDKQDDSASEVSLQIDANVNMPGGKGPVSSVGFVTETWIKTGGKWYILPNMPGAKGG